MADYKELLRKAIAALPENNGAARRAVYEKARAALVGQLRAIQPPLAARDITTHRLQLEDGIRQVEQEASQAVIAKFDQAEPDADAPRPAAKPATPPRTAAPVITPKAQTEGADAPAKPQPTATDTPKPVVTAKSTPAAPPNGKKPTDGDEPQLEPAASPPPKPKTPSQRTEPTLGAEPAKAETPRATPPKPVVVAKNDNKEPAPQPEEKPAAATRAGRPLPSIVARAEAAKARTTAFGVPADRAADSGRGNDRRPIIERREAASATRIEPTAFRGQAVARQIETDPAAFDAPAVAAAMSTVREVDVEPVLTADPQGAIDRAIATLDREARGEGDPDIDEAAATEPEADEPARGRAKPAKGFPDPVRPKKQRAERAEAKPRKERGDRADRPDRSPFVADGPFPRQETDRGGISALTIFLFVFVILLAAVGGAGFWAWREGYIDLDRMFGSNASTANTVGTAATDLTPPVSTNADGITGPGNTSATPSAVAAIENNTTSSGAPVVVDDRLTPSQPDQPATTDTAAAAPEVVAPLALAPSADSDEVKTEERLTVDTSAAPQTADQALAAVDPSNVPGSQSLLLEASDDGSAGAVPFSGTVEWSKGVDEVGLPTLIGKANIPARNMGLDLLIRKNSDPSLPASHLMEINFSVSETFIGGSVAGLPGVLLKNEELVQGSPLVGASARVVGNQFLFALSASPGDSAANSALMTDRKWLDIALIYATGKRAIITLEKDDAAMALFKEVFTAWGDGGSPAQ